MDLTNPLQTLTEKQTSELLQVTPACLQKMRREGRGPRFIRVGRLIRYRATEVLQFLDRDKSESPGAPGPAITAVPGIQPEAPAPIKPKRSDTSARTVEDW
jgi:hypothetical protein